MTSKAVWTWLPGCSDPVVAGTYVHTSVNRGWLGSFTYSPDYVSTAHATPLDQRQLARFNGTSRTTELAGLFGVFRDARPEGFGLDMLLRERGSESLSDLDALEYSTDDAVGALGVCEDIQAKIAFKPSPSEAMFSIMAELGPGQSSANVATRLEGLPSSSLGGERPKITVIHEGQQWIAKFAGRNDDPTSTLREYISMRLASMCEIQAALVQYVSQNGRGVILVKRFDRQVNEDGEITRMHFASAATVLGEANSRSGARGRSYLRLALEAERWGVKGHKAEMWRRMAFNVLVGNGDDHPRNHGLLRGEGGWALSPAYDIAPYTPNGGVPLHVRSLSMAVLRDGSAEASADALLKAAKEFGVSYEEANEYLDRTYDLIQHRWVPLAEEVNQKPLAPPLFELPPTDQRISKNEWMKYRVR